MLYFCGVDPTQGGIKRTAGVPGLGDVGDDFGIATFAVPDDFSKPPAFCHMYVANGLTSKQMSARIHIQHMHFNYSLIVMDPGGGGYAVRDNLREPEQDTGAERFKVTPIITKDDDQMIGVGQDCMALFSRADSLIKDCHTKIPSESYLPNRMHEIFAGALDSEPQGVILPQEWSGWAEGGVPFNDPDQMREYLMVIKPQGRDRVAALIDLALHQLAAVEREMDENGNLIKDKTGHYIYASKQKKDAAYAMLYSFFAYDMWTNNEHVRGKKEDDSHTFCAKATEV